MPTFLFSFASSTMSEDKFWLHWNNSSRCAPRFKRFETAVEQEKEETTFRWSENLLEFFFKFCQNMTGKWILVNWFIILNNIFHNHDYFDWKVSKRYVNGWKNIEFRHRCRVFHQRGPEAVKAEVVKKTEWATGVKVRIVENEDRWEPMPEATWENLQLFCDQNRKFLNYY